MDKEKGKQKSYYLLESQEGWVKDEAIRQGRSESWIIQQLIKQAKERQAHEPPDSR